MSCESDQNYQSTDEEGSSSDVVYSNNQDSLLLAMIQAFEDRIRMIKYRRGHNAGDPNDEQQKKQAGW